MEISIDFGSIISSLIGGSITAILFFLLCRPKIKISNSIVKNETKEGRIYYQFKFYNTSIFSANDVKPTLFFGQPKEASDVQIDVVYEEIPMSKRESFFVSGWKPIFKRTKYAPHCIKIKFFLDELKKLKKFNFEDKDLEDVLSVFGAMLELRISLRHGLSNLSRTKTAQFNRAGCIITGEEFEFGNSIKTKKC